MASRQYSLLWENYAKHLSNAFDSLRGDRDLTDVTLSCEGKRVPAHKMLFSACSNYFKALFKENPCQHPVIIFRNVAFVDLLALIEFMYKGEVNVEEERLTSFLSTAELLEVQGLIESGKEVDKIRSKELDQVHSLEQKNVVSESTMATKLTEAMELDKMERETEKTQPKAFVKDPTIETIEDDMHLKMECPNFEYIELNPQESYDGDELTPSERGMENELENYSNDSLAEPSNENDMLAVPSIENDMLAVAEPLNDSPVLDRDPEPQLEGEKSALKVKAGLQCPICWMTFDSRPNCSTHMNTHTRKSTCRLCRKKVSSTTNLRRHYAEVHMNRSVNVKQTKHSEKGKLDPFPLDLVVNPAVIRRGQNFECSVCSRRFSYRQRCVEHIDVHLGNTTCRVCGKTVSSRQKLKEHIMRTHALSRTKYKCQKCGKCQPSEEYLKKHTFECIGRLEEQPTSTEKKEDTFSTKQPGEKKMIVFKGKQLVPKVVGFRSGCPICKRTFKSHTICFEHMQVHTGETTCEVCDKVLASRSKLREHMAIHDGRTQCSFCEKILSSEKVLKEHLFICQLKVSTATNVA